MGPWTTLGLLLLVALGSFRLGMEWQRRCDGDLFQEYLDRLDRTDDFCAWLEARNRRGG